MKKLTLLIMFILIMGYSQVGAEELPQKGTITLEAEEIDSFLTKPIYIYTPTIYICSIHGEVEEWHVFHFAVESDSDLNGKYCMKCFAKWAKDNFNQVKPK